jgi:hypothetical protein
MAKDSDKLHGSFELGETGGALSGLLAEEDEFDRRALWRLGTWAVVSIGAVVAALVTSQSSMGLRREQTASADLIRQAQQIQLAAKESQNDARRLASAVETLNSDRDRLYSRVAVLEQGLDSVTGAISRQSQAPSSSQANATPAAPAMAASAGSPPSSASQTQPSTASQPLPAIASVEPPPTAAKSPPPAVAPVAATAPAVIEKQDKQALIATSPEPSPPVTSSPGQPSPSTQPSGSLIASKSMMAPPDPAAAKLIEPPAAPKVVTSAPLPEIVAAVPKPSEEAELDSSAGMPEVAARRTEFGVDVGGANSIPGLRALWRGLLKSKANAALTTLRPIIVIKENNNGLGMQLRLVAGPIGDAAAAAKICASLTLNERGCTTTVFEGQRLALNAEEQAKADAKLASEAKPVPEAKPAPASKPSGHRHYVSKRSAKDEEAPKQEPSTLSFIFGRR